MTPSTPPGSMACPMPRHSPRSNFWRAFRRITPRPTRPLDAQSRQCPNHRSRTAGPETIATDNAPHTETFTLPQLAISNLGLLRPGKVTVQALDGKPVPDWFDESYLRNLITKVDVAQHYPAMLLSTLLDDPMQRSRRESLLRRQLHTQLPALALELNLRGKPIGFDVIKDIGDVFGEAPQRSTAWQMRPLGLLRSLDASPDHPLNTWLIEAQTATSQPCLLYRPLHSEPLLAFEDRQALLDAIAAPGPLQDDLLERLPEQARKVYAHGGFLEPHLFHPWKMTGPSVRRPRPGHPGAGASTDRPGPRHLPRVHR